MSTLVGLDYILQRSVIDACSAILDNPLQPFQDTQGNLLQVPMLADFPDQVVSSPICLVGIEPGTKSMGGGAGWGRMGMTDDKTMWNNLLVGFDYKAVFSIYASSDYLRKFLADWLQWGMMTGYATGAQGQRLDFYVIGQLIKCGIYPQLDRLFEVNMGAPNPNEPRPAGLPWRAQVRMRFDVQLAYQTPTTVPAMQSLTITPTVQPVPIRGNGAVPTPVPSGTGTAALEKLALTIPLPASFYP